MPQPCCWNSMEAASTPYDLVRAVPEWRTSRSNGPRAGQEWASAGSVSSEGRMGRQVRSHPGYARSGIAVPGGSARRVAGRVVTAAHYRPTGRTPGDLGDQGADGDAEYQVDRGGGELLRRRSGGAERVHHRDQVSEGEHPPE